MYPMHHTRLFRSHVPHTLRQSSRIRQLAVGANPIRPACIVCGCRRADHGAKPHIPVCPISSANVIPLSCVGRKTISGPTTFGDSSARTSPLVRMTLMRYGTAYATKRLNKTMAKPASVSLLQISAHPHPHDPTPRTLLAVAVTARTRTTTKQHVTDT